MKIDLNELERKARAATQDEWQWRPEDLGVLEGKHDGQVVLWGNLDAADTDEPLIVVSDSDRRHIAANSPPVTLALVARIRELEGFIQSVPPAALMADKVFRDDFPELFTNGDGNALYMNEAQRRIIKKGAG